MMKIDEIASWLELWFEIRGWIVDQIREGTMTIG